MSFRSGEPGPRDKKIKPGQIFVFGSNRAGIHGAGAAATAVEQYGAKIGVGEGFQGNSYAIPTKDGKLRSLPLTEIQHHVDSFILYSKLHKELKFFVTRIGCGLAGYEDGDIGPMFKGSPPNVELPDGWG